MLFEDWKETCVCTYYMARQTLKLFSVKNGTGLTVSTASHRYYIFVLKIETGYIHGYE